MRQYSLILLDADGTLFDFNLAEADALQKAFAYHQFAYSDEVRTRYSEINSSMWKQLEKGQIEKADLKTARFRNLFRERGLEADPVTFSAVYEDYLGEGRHMIAGAVEVCRELSQHYTLAIASNGIAKIQRSRIKGSPIEPYIKHLIISEEAGYEKPRQGFFEYALKTCGVEDKAQVMIVGDSLTADIKGGADFGITTCWYNPEGLVNNSGIKIDHEIRELKELLGILA